MIKLIRCFCLISICLSHHSFATTTEKVSYGEMIKRNSQNITKVTLNMTKEEVLEIMGNIVAESGTINNPWKIEFNGDLEIMHFITSKHPPFTPILARQATPVIIKNGKVAAVGRTALKNLNDFSLNPTQPSSQNQNDINSLEERLKKLNQLYESGAIDKPTYDAQKNKILDSI